MCQHLKITQAFVASGTWCVFNCSGLWCPIDLSARVFVVELASRSWFQFCVVLVFKVAVLTVLFSFRLPMKRQKSVDDIPEEVWWYKTCCFLRTKELSILRRVSTFFEKYWQQIFATNHFNFHLCVPHDVTLQDSINVAISFSERRVYTREDPIRIQLEEGTHEILNTYCKRMTVNCSNILLIGNGKNTTILGGLYILNQVNIALQHLSISNPEGYGLQIKDNCCYDIGRINVIMKDVTVQHCKTFGVEIGGGGENVALVATTCQFNHNLDAGVFAAGSTGNISSSIDSNEKVKLVNCKMQHNKNGLVVTDQAAVNVYGTLTSIDHNNNYGIWACNAGAVYLHVSMQHETSTKNGKIDRRTMDYKNYIQSHDGLITNVNKHD